MSRWRIFQLGLLGLLGLLAASLALAGPAPDSGAPLRTYSGRLRQEQGAWLLWVHSTDRRIGKATFRLGGPGLAGAPLAEGRFVSVQAREIACPGRYRCLEVANAAHAAEDPIQGSALKSLAPADPDSPEQPALRKAPK